MIREDRLEIGLPPVEGQGGGYSENGIPYAVWPLRVSGFGSPVLVAGYEERCGCFRIEMPYLPASEGRASEASGTQRGSDAIWVVVDRLTKSAHFIPMRVRDSVDHLADLYVRDVVRLHGVPRHLPLVEFAYNNSFQSSIGMAPFEALYGRPCRSPVCWAEVGDAPLWGPELVRETTEKVELIRRRLVTAQSRQKSYADRRRRPLAFEILERIGEVAYRLALPPQLSGVHDVFHVSMLRKYEPDPSHVLDWSDLEVDEDASYEERPVRVLDRRDQVLRGKTIPLVKVLWKHHGVEEATWERELEVQLTCLSVEKGKMKGTGSMPPPRT
ncbi:hypothetical protein CsSME_00030948 [Camellia sinensis var. sinensis]